MQSFIHLFIVVQLFSHVWLFETLWTAACQASLPFTISQSLLKLMSIESVMPSNHNILCLPLLLLPSICPSIRGFSNESALHTMCVAKVLELQLQHQSFQWIFRVDLLKNWLVWSPCCPRDSQESSPAPQFESINSLALSLLYDPTLTSIHDYWKNHSFDYMDLFQQSNVSASCNTWLLITESQPLEVQWWTKQTGPSPPERHKQWADAQIDAKLCVK